MSHRVSIWTELDQAGFALLMEMRGITVQEVADEMGKSVVTVKDLLRGRRRAGPSGRVRIRTATLHAVDSAITRITDRKGGVFAACGSTLAGVEETTRMLASA